VITRQTRIFVPATVPYENISWKPTLVASVIATLVANAHTMEWYWFSEYVALRADSGDCDITAIPEEFGISPQFASVGAQGYFRSLRFRYQMAEEDAPAFEALASDLIAQQGCAISDFRDYPWTDDLGGNRFFGGNETPERRTRRATNIAQFLCHLCRVYIDCLVGPDPIGHFSIELTHSEQNPGDSPFESIHHLFCNITSVPTRILVGEGAIGTDFSPPALAPGGRVAVFQVRF